MTEPANRRVLVLDDDADFCDLLRLFLESTLPVECVVVRKLSELVARAPEALTCELALLDVNLGHGEPSGIDALEWLYANGFPGSVVFLTGHARCHPLLSRLVESSSIRVFEKPVETGTLVSLFPPPPSSYPPACPLVDSSPGRG